MGQQVQESQIANYRRRMQREAPAARMPSLFEQNDALRQVYTVTVTAGCGVDPGQRVHAHLAQDPAGGYFVVTDCAGRRVGAIRDESARVLADALRQNRLSAVSLTVTGLVPVVGDARVQITPE